MSDVSLCVHCQDAALLRVTDPEDWPQPYVRPWETVEEAIRRFAAWKHANYPKEAS